MTMFRLARALPEDDLDEVVLARPVVLRGIGTRVSGETLAVGRDGPVGGALFAGTLDAPVTEAARSLLDSSAAASMVTLHLGDDDAKNAGLSCGGHVDLLLQRASALPAGVLDRLRSSRMSALITDVDAGTARALPPTGTHPRPEGVDPVGETVSRLVRAGSTAAAVNGTTVIEVFVPVTRLLVVGSSVLADALVAQGSLLGWEVEATSSAAAAADALASLGPTDGVVLFAHDAAVDDPVLAAALRSDIGYIGALGSRRTQAERRARLVDAGVPAEAFARVHGPVGLDIGARTPPETALAICAELLAAVSGRQPVSLRDATGPIHPEL